MATLTVRVSFLVVHTSAFTPALIGTFALTSQPLVSTPYHHEYVMEFVYTWQCTQSVYDFHYGNTFHGIWLVKATGWPLYGESQPWLGYSMENMTMSQDFLALWALMFFFVAHGICWLCMVVSWWNCQQNKWISGTNIIYDAIQSSFL